MPTERRSQTRRSASPEELERTLPHNLEAERSVLGTILVNNGIIEAVAAILKSDQFYRDVHAQIFTAMLRLTKRSVAVDGVTLNEELAREGILDGVGGPAFIGGLADGIPRSTNATHYARIIVQKAELRGLIKASNKVLAAAYDAQETPKEILSLADREFLQLRRGYDRGRLTPLAETANERFTELEWRVANKGALRGLDTGFQSINDLTLGWRGGDVIIIAAKTSMGKSTFSINSFVHAATRPLFSDPTRYANLAVFSLEMKRPQLEDRILAQLSRLSLDRIQGGFIAGPDWAILADALNTMHAMALSIDDRSRLNANDIWTSCRRHISEHGVLDGILVDYVQLLGSMGLRKAATRSEEIGDNLSSLKDLAGEFNAPVVVVSQLNRGEGRPKLEHLRESGALEQVADIVGLLYRRDHKVSGTTEFIMAKQRNGRTGTVNLTLDRDTTTFMDGGEPIPEPTPEEKQATAKSRKRSFAIRASHQDGG